MAVMAAAMLAIGVAVGAAIGPAPAPSQADPTLPLLLTSLARGAAARAAQARAAAAQSATAAAEATPARKRHRRKRKHAKPEEAATATSSAPASESETTTPTSTTPTSKPKTSPLPPVTHVWLIELAGTSFASATAQPTAAPYIDTQAIPAGTLLSGWSALDGGAFASEAALVAGSSPQLLDTIVQPPCPEGTAGASCTTEAGALTAADEFLKATVPTITSTAAFRESGAIVVTFASVASATATGLPAGASTATLTSQPPAGVLLISPFAAVGAHSSTTFNPTSPKQSLEKLLRR
ncbi:MAG TPA: hypothetical protein VK790_06980 [Solirubrobacteraceae bacterium]|nr:hypothetical protein [Solirubrobacteraceae bacterium]